MNFESIRNSCAFIEMSCSYSMEERLVIVCCDHVVMMRIDEFHSLCSDPILLLPQTFRVWMKKDIPKHFWILHFYILVLRFRANHIDPIPVFVKLLQCVPERRLLSLDN